MNMKRLKADLRLPLVLLLLMAVLTIVSPRFLTISNLSNVLWSVCVISILASGAIYAPITGGIDLSIGSIAALTGIVVDILMNRAGINWMVSILFTILLGAFIGLFNGVITAKFRVNAFIVTMAAKTYLYGVAMVVSHGGMQSVLKPAQFIAIGGGRTFGLPNPIYIMLILIAASHVLLTRSSFGRRTIAVGANEVAAKLSGVNPDRTRMAAYAVSGGTAAIGGIVLASLTQQSFAAAASGIELDVLTALVVGGTSLLGGKGSVAGALIGAIMVAFIENGLNLLNVAAPYHPISTGIVILLALILNQGFSGGRRSPARNRQEPRRTA
ncbi:MAG TPA: ABC transporter permease [Rectinemataceae bacterium]|nr:ABC transporter permease [Rectinemataceae bacterium]